MDELLRPVKSVRSNIAKFESLSVSESSDGSRPRQRSTSSSRKSETPDRKRDPSQSGKRTSRLIEEVDEDDEALIRPNSTPSQHPLLPLGLSSGTVTGARSFKASEDEKDSRDDTDSLGVSSLSDKENQQNAKYWSARQSKASSKSEHNYLEVLPARNSSDGSHHQKNGSFDDQEKLRLDISIPRSSKSSHPQNGNPVGNPVSPVLNPISPNVKPCPLSLRPNIPASLAEMTPSSLRDAVHHDRDSALPMAPPECDSVHSAQNAVSILKSQPNSDQFREVLTYLDSGMKGEHSFNVKVQSAAASSLTMTLVGTALVDFWDDLQSSKQDRSVLLKCLTSVAGIAALWSFLGILIKDFKQRGVQGGFQSKSHKALARNVLDVLGDILLPTKAYTLLSNILDDIFQLYGSRSGAREAVLQELISLIAGSRILSTVGEATHVMKCLDSNEDSNAWMADASRWSIWLGSNISHAAMQANLCEEEKWRAISSMTMKSLSLGRPQMIMAELYTGLLFGSKALWPQMRALFSNLRFLHDRRMFLDVLLRDLTDRYLMGQAQVSGSEFAIDNREAVGGVAAIVAGLIEDREEYVEFLSEFLVSSKNGTAVECCLTKRAMLAVLARKEERLKVVLEKSLKAFGDKYAIQNNSMVAQEALAQVALLTIGYLHRIQSPEVANLSQSSLFLNAVSNRLAASLPRARYLGMVFGMSVSRLVDAPDKAINFDGDEMHTEEANWYMGLVNVDDQIGTIDALKQRSVEDVPRHTRNSSRKTLQHNGPKNPRPKPKAPNRSKVVAIEEVEDSDSEDPDLIPYQKPDDDPSDSDEDPTLINRSKPKAPVYIAGLITQLRSDDPDTLEISLRTAPSLIRRKAGFGTELAENIDPLLATLVNLQEKGGNLSEEAFHDLLTQSLISAFIAMPIKVAPWLTTIYFTGDFSMAQRAAILTVIGLGSRELAGFDDALTSTAVSQTPDLSFPSKTLPPHLAAAYTPTPTTPQNRLAPLTESLYHTTLRPLAESATATLSGPSALQIRRFSSRPSVSAAQKATASRSSRTPKDLHRILSHHLILPLSSRLALLCTRLTPSTTVYFYPPILKLYLQTLTILLSSLGPNANDLNAALRELLILLTALHVRGGGEGARDRVVLPAFLHLLLTVLCLVEEKGGVLEERFIGECGEMVVGVMGWVEGLEGVVPKGDSSGKEGGGGEMEWTVLAAGCQVKWAEIGRRWQGRLMGMGVGVEGF
ncbi:MAG: hypothetical protein Q9227_009148 [Pyrenula ochraceoflavens]